MKIPENVTNPKTLRKWERHIKEWEEITQYARDNGFTVFKKGTNCWSFRKGDQESPYGFDTQGEAYLFIKNSNGNLGIF